MNGKIPKDIAWNGKSTAQRSFREPGPMAESPGREAAGKCVRERSSTYQAINESGTAVLPPLMPVQV